ncbi:hypothetical protein [Actinomadura alba]|uniref:Uncharacterized protein n=1 Tax=Actinomadura alba TaxID=406431 RepID=A0ABR7M1D2_9ACTN|nr:hypothetical protein [Actinomadura alba]MBC6470927.1 hypothetical protein [Actinomadura alba]
MSIKINEDSMTATIDGAEIARATRVDGSWLVSTWPHALNYNQAITALVLAERLSTGHGEADPLVIVWREELAHG